MRLKKSLGQHFLIDEIVCEKIAVATLQLQPSKLLEIGPGAGSITKYFINSDKIKEFKAFEIDQEKVNFLHRTYPKNKDKIIHQDILNAQIPFAENFCIVGNFPYNISSQIVFQIINWKDNVEHAIGMFQKEVAERIVAKPHNKEYGILSILTQTYFDASLLFIIEPKSFNPPPKVRSAMVLLSRKKETLDIKNYDLYARVIKTAFQQRRKQLRNSLSSLFLKDGLKSNFFNQRPENLSVEDFYNLYLLLLSK